MRTIRLHNAIAKARHALKGDSNDAEHDALIELLQAIADEPKRPTLRENFTGRLRVSRVQRGGEDGPIMEVEIIDDASRTRVVEARASLEDFMRAITSSEVECVFSFGGDAVGWRHEHKTEEIVFVDRYAKPDVRQREAKRALKPFEVDGWTGRADDLFNEHNRVKGSGTRNTHPVYKVSFFRHVRYDGDVIHIAAP